MQKVHVMGKKEREKVKLMVIQVRAHNQSVKDADHK